jgi:hypothetical protein
VREAARRFVTLLRGPDRSSVLWKAAFITSADLVEGDYLEFGVFRGDSFIKAYKCLEDVYEDRATRPDGIHSQEYRDKTRRLWESMRFIAFDSFQGLPRLGNLDRLSRDFSEGMFVCSVEEFAKRLRSRSIDLSKVVVVPGWFEDTCQEETIVNHRMKAACIVNIDCDLYESTKLVLKFTEPLLVDGTVLIFDDWYYFRGNPNLGEQRAFREWVQDKTEWVFTEYQKEGPNRNSFIASRRRVGLDPKRWD